LNIKSKKKDKQNNKIQLHAVNTVITQKTKTGKKWINKNAKVTACS